MRVAPAPAAEAPSEQVLRYDTFREQRLLVGKGVGAREVELSRNQSESRLRADEVLPGPVSLLRRGDVVTKWPQPNGKLELRKWGPQGGFTGSLGSYEIDDDEARQTIRGTVGGGIGQTLRVVFVDETGASSRESTPEGREFEISHGGVMPGVVVVLEVDGSEVLSVGYAPVMAVERQAEVRVVLTPVDRPLRIALDGYLSKDVPVLVELEPMPGVFWKLGDGRAQSISSLDVMLPADASIPVRVSVGVAEPRREPRSQLVRRRFGPGTESEVVFRFLPPPRIIKGAFTRPDGARRWKPPTLDASHAWGVEVERNTSRGLDARLLVDRVTRDRACGPRRWWYELPPGESRFEPWPLPGVGVWPGPGSTVMVQAVVEDRGENEVRQAQVVGLAALDCKDKLPAWAQGLFETEKNGHLDLSACGRSILRTRKPRAQTCGWARAQSDGVVQLQLHRLGREGAASGVEQWTLEPGSSPDTATLRRPKGTPITLKRVKGR